MFCYFKTLVLSISKKHSVNGVNHLDPFSLGFRFLTSAACESSLSVCLSESETLNAGEYNYDDSCSLFIHLRYKSKRPDTTPLKKKVLKGWQVLKYSCAKTTPPDLPDLPVPLLLFTAAFPDNLTLLEIGQKSEIGFTSFWQARKQGNL